MDSPKSRWQTSGNPQRAGINVWAYGGLELFDILLDAAG
jgi:hypothetical protein